jgi:hypothetical protein
MGKVAEEENLLDVAWPIKSCSIDNLLGGYGVQVAENADLNTSEYLKVGTYLCTLNSTVATLKNCPTTYAFKMTVTNLFHKDCVPQNNVGAYWYLIREITGLYGHRYFQAVSCGPTGDWIYDVWRTRLDDFLVKDYIVEQGTSGIWTYRKWNSGNAECWGSYTHGVSFGNTWGSMYYADPLTPRISYPFTFSSRPVENVSLKSGALAGWLYVEGGSASLNNTTQTAQYGICRPTTSTESASFTLDFNVVGKWK